MFLQQRKPWLFAKSFNKWNYLVSHLDDTFCWRLAEAYRNAASSCQCHDYLNLIKKPIM